MMVENAMEASDTSRAPGGQFFSAEVMGCFIPPTDPGVESWKSFGLLAYSEPS